MDLALKKAPELWRVKLKRPICLVLTIVLFLGIIFAIFFIPIPGWRRRERPWRLTCPCMSPRSRCGGTVSLPLPTSTASPCRSCP